MIDRQPRPLPTWGWALAALFFPSGVFVAFGTARLLSWPKAIMGALLSYGCVVAFAQLMAHWEQTGANPLVSSVTLLCGMIIFVAWGWVLHFIGRRAGYWSPTVQRGWKRAGWFAVALLCLGSAGVVLQLVARSRGA